MKRVEVICPTGRDVRELSYAQVRSGYEVLFNDSDQQNYDDVVCPGFGTRTYAFDPLRLITAMIKKSKQRSIDGLMGTQDYPGTIVASIVARTRIA